MNKDYYKILGVERNASEEQIKKAFHKLSIQWHPDKWANASEEERKSAEEKFKEIAEAYGVLSDKDKRSQYDAFGTTGGYSGGMDMDDDISEMFRRFSSFGGFGGFRQTGRNLNASHTVTIGVDDIYFGREKTFKYHRTAKCHVCNGKGSTTEDGIETCQYCGGSGMITNTQHRGNTIIQNMTTCHHCHGKGKNIKNPCKNCGGTGFEKIEDELTVKIPAGVVSGATITIPGYGNFSSDGSNRCGDLDLTFMVVPCGEYAQSGQFNLYTEIDVPILDCITGKKTTIGFLDGSEKEVEIPMGCKDGEVVRLPGLGLPMNGGRRGELLVVVNQVMPKKIDSVEKKAIEELKTHKNFMI